MAEIAECTTCQLIITKIPFIPLRRTLFPVSSPLVPSPSQRQNRVHLSRMLEFSYASLLPSEMHRYAARLPARSRSCISCHEDSGLHRRRRLDKLVCLSVSTHASTNTYGVEGGREGNWLRWAGSSAPKASDDGAKAQKNNRP